MPAFLDSKASDPLSSEPHVPFLHTGRVAMATAAAYLLLPTLALVSLSLLLLIQQIQKTVTPLKDATISQIDRLILQTDDIKKTASAFQEAAASIHRYISDQRSLSVETADVLQKWSEVSLSFTLHLQDGSRLCNVLADSLPPRLPSGVNVEWKQIELPGPNPSYPTFPITWKYFDGEKSKLVTMSQSLDKAGTAMESTGRTLKQMAEALGRDSSPLITKSLKALEEAESRLDNLSQNTLPALAQELEVEKTTASRLPLISKYLTAFFVASSIGLLLLGICVATFINVLQELPKRSASLTTETPKQKEARPEEPH